MSQTSNVWKIFAHTNVLTMNITHAHMQIISDAWDTFGITGSFGFELIIFRSFSGTAIGEFAVGCGMTLACAVPLMRCHNGTARWISGVQRLGELMRMDMAF